jgi:hypothetical protein
MVAQGLAPLEALAQAKQARWQVSPSPEQLEAFTGWAEEWRASHGLSWALPTFEELADIAYKHLRRPQGVGE